jgi:hypothetical protein
MAMKPRAMKNGKTKKMMRGGMADNAYGHEGWWQSWRKKNDARRHGKNANGNEARWRS